LKVSVHYSLPFRDDVGSKEEAYEIEQDSATVGEVLQSIVRKHPSMARFVDTQSEEAQRRHMVAAVNSKLARLSDEVHDGDKISLLLPVIGG
jgi:molybdopterin converting factor small subunit